MGWIAALLSGLIAGFTYPTVFAGHQLPDLGFMAFFAWVPLFLSIRGSRPAGAFAKSFVASMFHYGIGMYWIYTAMHSFGGLSSFTSVTALFLLVALISAYFGLIFWIAQWICRRNSLSPLWVRPFVWVGIEFLRGHIPAGGFPWSQIGYSQGGFLSFIQVSDIFGVYGVTWLLVFFNEAISEAIVQWRRGKRSRAWKVAAIAAAFFLADLGYGRYQMVQESAVPTQSLKVGIVQGNIPQEEKWDKSLAEQNLEVFQNGTMGLEEQGASLILWPEAALPYELNYDAATVPYDLGQRRADLLFGAVTRPSARSRNRHEETFHNTALLTDSQRKILGYYHKRHLVPFGEYVPWKDYLFFAKKMTAQVGELQPGEDYHPLEYKGGLLGVLIAVETRRTLIRAANTGLSSQIDRHGRVLWQGGLFTREAFLANLPYYNDRSLYVQLGDVLPIFSLAFIGLMFLIPVLRRAPR
ncbi:MAG: apolipoprotein N-acyltransferase [Deltaproteobacteria bacterium]|nr:apolipoprotein N-acyltransferase [Deltaproteobacteria bacterium]